MPGPDLDAYFRRVGYDGPRAPTLAVLAALHRAQPSEIPFESLDPLQGLAVELGLDALERKLVQGRRGGYCFELNGLFLAVLQSLGFQVTPLAARVRWMLPPDAPATPLSHMLLLVHLPEGDFLCDVGFGSQTPIAPLRFVEGPEQETVLGRYRLTEQAGQYDLALLLPDGWSTLYRFRVEAQGPRDYELFNWYTATHPQSRFVNNLVAARIVGDRRKTLFNREFAVHNAQGPVARTVCETPEALQGLLCEDFGIAVEADDIRRLWQRLPLPLRG
jgi:N-hydroxyarylamine O-acetyltransferase